VQLSSETLTNVFNDVFKDNRGDLDREWRTHMDSLKTDKERILGDRW
jgi:hypothetical protein